MLLGAYVLWGSCSFRKGQGGVCEGVEVEVREGAVAQFVTSGEVIELLKREGVYPVGKDWKEVNTEKLEKSVEAHAMVSEAEAYVTPCGKVKVVVCQREPVLRVQGREGNFYVDRCGQIMPLSARSTVSLPLARGYVERELATGMLYEIALFLRDDGYWHGQIAQLYVDRAGEVELIPSEGEHRIVLGKPEGFEEKLSNLRLFYEQAIPKFGWEKYSVISVKYRDQVVCTRR